MNEQAAHPSVEIRVDVASQAPLRRIWRYVGYDEPNYTYTENGRELLAKLGRMQDGPYYIRCHFLLCSGNGSGEPKWGSTNVYTEDEAGRPAFDWHIIDRIFDTIIECGCTPFVELGFVPEALTSAPPGTPYMGATAEGWRYPPRDYGRWMELIRALAAHCLARYGLREVSCWYWELWNEPDIFYWRGTVEAYCRLYDYTVAALVSVLPQAKVGGPGTTSPGNENAGAFLRDFLAHCTGEENAVTGEMGTRLDFISFHTKGGGYGREPGAPKKTPTLHTLMRHVAAGLEIVAGFPALRQHEVILSECDPDGWAAGSIRENPNLFYRNTEYYASYVASAACQLLAAGHPQGPRVDGMLTWAFQFEDREAFAGLRTLSTQGVDKPILSVFRLLATMGGAMVDLTSNGARDPVAQGRGDLPGDPPNVSGIASVDALGILRLFLVSHHDDWDVEGLTELRVRIAGLDKDTRYEAKQIRIDGDHANAHTTWTHLGKPAWPSEAQLVRLREASRLRSTPLDQIETEDGLLSLSLTLPTHGICLVELQPVWQPSEI